MRFLVPVAGLLVAGCLSVLPEAGPGAEIYRLNGAGARAVAAAAVSDAGRSDLTVLVPEPLASRALSTDRVAVIADGDHLSYAAGARWNERAPRVVQERILTAFEDDARVGAAVRPEDGVQSDFELRLDLIRFEAVYRNGPEAAPVALVELRAKLIDRSTRDLVASSRFEAEQTADANRMGLIIAAFDAAMDDVGYRLIGWTLDEAASAAADAENAPQPSASAASSSR